MDKSKYERCRECKFGYWVEHVPFCTLKKRPCDYVDGKLCDGIFEEKGSEEMAGRPIESAFGQRMDKLFKMRINSRLDNSLDKLAKKLNCSKSEAVRTAIYEYLKNHENC